MKSPEFYPNAVDVVEHKQTHISDVFLVGNLVYKLKKQVDTGFLNFTTQEKRRRFCRREIELNRRLSTGIYLGVEEITRDRDKYMLAGSGDVVDYVVKMKRLDDGDNLQSMLRQNRAQEEFLARLTDVLVNFYRNSKSSKDIESGGDVQQILVNCRENFTQLQSSAATFFGTAKPKLEVIKAATESFVKHHQELFHRRVK